MMWPFKKRRAYTRDDMMRPGILFAQGQLRAAMANGDWDAAAAYARTLARYMLEYPGAIDPMLVAYVGAKRHAQAVYEWFEPEYGRPR